MSGFRVWWSEEDEEDGKLYPDRPSTEGGLVEQILANDRWAVDAENAAEVYADFFYHQRDGYECTWPLTFRVRSPDGSITTFQVDMEFDPTFTARSSS